MTQKSNQYIKMFTLLFGVSLLSCILSRLSIFCISPAKQCDIKNNDSCVTFNLYFKGTSQNIVEARSDPYVKCFSTFSLSKTAVLNFIAVIYCLHECSETILC